MGKKRSFGPAPVSPVVSSPSSSLSPPDVVLDDSSLSSSLSSNSSSGNNDLHNNNNNNSNKRQKLECQYAALTLLSFMSDTGPGRGMRNRFLWLVGDDDYCNATNNQNRNRNKNNKTLSMRPSASEETLLASLDTFRENNTKRTCVPDAFLSQEDPQVIPSLSLSSRSCCCDTTKNSSKCTLNNNTKGQNPATLVPLIMTPRSGSKNDGVNNNNNMMNAVTTTTKTPSCGLFTKTPAALNTKQHEQVPLLPPHLQTIPINKTKTSCCTSKQQQQHQNYHLRPLHMRPQVDRRHLIRLAQEQRPIDLTRLEYHDNSSSSSTWQQNNPNNKKMR